MFDKLGTKSSPSAPFLRIYRRLRKLIKQDFERPSLWNEHYAAAAKEIRELVGQLLKETADAAASEALYNLATLDIPLDNSLAGVSELLTTLRNQSLASIMEGFSNQQKQVIITGATMQGTGSGYKSMILGRTDADIGMVTPFPIILLSTLWITRTANLAWSGVIEKMGFSRPAVDRGLYYKQVISAADGRTTDCCLKARGQVQPFNKPFKLTGTPRFADEMDWAPFHNRCRTTVVLIDRRDAEDEVTGRLKQEAERELKRRRSSNVR